MLLGGRELPLREERHAAHVAAASHDGASATGNPSQTNEKYALIVLAPVRSHE